MLRFFRHIRKTLMEHPSKGRTWNKVRTYILYALGEILLVVIGIMIALQVNNWNEDRKAEQLAADYKVSLKADLQRDIAFYTGYIEYMENEVIRWNGIKERVIGQNANLDTLIYINKNDFNFYLRTFQEYNIGAYSTIEAAGDWSIFDKTFTEDLTGLRRLQIQSKEQVEIQFDLYAEALTNHGKNYPSNAPFEMISEGSLHEYLWSNLDKKEYIKSFSAVTKFRATYFRTTIGVTRQLLDASQQVLSRHFQN